MVEYSLSLGTNKKSLSNWLENLTITPWMAFCSQTKRTLFETGVLVMSCLCSFILNWCQLKPQLQVSMINDYDYLRPDPLPSPFIWTGISCNWWHYHKVRTTTMLGMITFHPWAAQVFCVLSEMSFGRWCMVGGGMKVCGKRLYISNEILMHKKVNKIKYKISRNQ